MRITVAAIGKAKSGAERELFAAYAARLPWHLTLKELEAKNASSPKDRRLKEAGLLLAAAAPRDVLVALDESGNSLSSKAFAGLLKQWQDRGRSRAAFVIGGADGLDGSVRGQADYILSLGPMTWPHLLARALLAEQLYRAYTILSGHPYHRE